jgi:hypothetical protein
MMKLNQLMLCLDCDEVNLKAAHCPLCASKGVVELSTWIRPYDTLKAGNPEDGPEKRFQSLVAECKGMAKKVEAMMAEVEEGPEPLGCGA